MTPDQKQKLLSSLAPYGTEVTGAALSALIRREYPYLIPGPVPPKGWLVRLVADHLSHELRAVGRRGMDVLYAIETQENPLIEPEGSAPDDGIVWTEFASPRSTRTIVLDAAFALLQVRRDGSIPAATEHVISHVTRDELRALANEFLDRHAAQLERSISKLRELVSEHASEAAHYDWFQTLRSASPALAEQWNILRRDGIVGLLKQRLAQIGGMTEPDMVRLCAQLRRSQIASFRSRQIPNGGRSNATKSLPVSNPSGAPEPITLSHEATAQTSADMLRAVVEEAVAQADVETLAQIRLPVGLLLEIFRKRAARGVL